MSAVEMTWEELAESLTGYDEIAITKNFDIDVYGDAETKPVLIQRALVFVHMRREGLSDAEAKNAVMEMSLKDVSDYCATGDDDVMPDDPDSESGKDSLALVGVQQT